VAEEEGKVYACWRGRGLAERESSLNLLLLPSWMGRRKAALYSLWGKKEGKFWKGGEKKRDHCLLGAKKEKRGTSSSPFRPGPKWLFLFFLCKERLWGGDSLIV